MRRNYVNSGEIVGWLAGLRTAIAIIKLKFNWAFNSKSKCKCSVLMCAQIYRILSNWESLSTSSTTSSSSSPLLPNNKYHTSISKYESNCWRNSMQSFKVNDAKWIVCTSNVNRWMCQAHAKCMHTAREREKEREIDVDDDHDEEEKINQIIGCVWISFTWLGKQTRKMIIFVTWNSETATATQCIKC